jgi:pimeloyl-ACP methyl ester carboxylesterase
MRVATIDPPSHVFGTVVLLHGFGRSPERLDGLSARLASLGARVLLPALSPWWWPTCTNNTRYLNRVADAIAAASAPDPIVVVGHSAGAAAGAWIAARLIKGGYQVTSVVFVDGVDSPVRSIRRSWPVLQHRGVVAICGDPSPCNRHGALERWLRAQPAEDAADLQEDTADLQEDTADRQEDTADLQIVSVPGMGHGDVEGAGIGVYVRLCKDNPSAPQREVLLDLIVGAVSRGLQAPAN